MVVNPEAETLEREAGRKKEEGSCRPSLVIHATRRPARVTSSRACGVWPQRYIGGMDASRVPHRVHALVCVHTGVRTLRCDSSRVCTYTSPHTRVCGRACIVKQSRSRGAAAASSVRGTRDA